MRGFTSRLFFRPAIGRLLLRGACVSCAPAGRARPRVRGPLGALPRWALDSHLDRRSGDFPWGRFVVNVSRAFRLGVAVELMRGSLETVTWFRTGITVGLLGAYTTFSTLSLDTYRLLEEGEIGFARLNTVGSLTAGLLAVWLGILAGDALS